MGSQLAIDGDRMAERQALIVMHGGPGFDHSTMRPYFDRFADTHQIVYIDHRGNGRSTGAPETWTLAQWGDDVKALCDALGIVKPVVYGNSFGGMVAMAYATRYPDHPAKLILSSTAARLRLDVTYRLLEERGGKEARRYRAPLLDQAGCAGHGRLLRVCIPLYNPPNAHSAAVAQAFRRAVMRAEVSSHFILGEMRTMDAIKSLSRISMPHADHGRRLRSDHAGCLFARKSSTALPKGLGQLEIVPGAGHGVHRDEPEKAEAIYRTFLAGSIGIIVKLGASASGVGARAASPAFFANPICFEKGAAEPAALRRDRHHAQSSTPLHIELA